MRLAINLVVVHNVIFITHILSVFYMQDQYHFLHQALIESMMLSSSALPSSRFLDSYEELLTFDDKARCFGINREFEVAFVKIVCLT